MNMRQYCMELEGGTHKRGWGLRWRSNNLPNASFWDRNQQTWPFWESLASSHAYSKKNVHYAQRTAFWNTENPCYFRLLTHNIISLRILTSLLCSWIWKGFSVSMLYSIWLFEFLPSWLFVLSGWGIYNLSSPWIESFEASLHHKHSLLG